MTATILKGHFSNVTGTDTRRVFDQDGNFVGLIIKQDDGYQIRRFKDGKIRIKPTLKQAFATLKRVN